VEDFPADVADLGGADFGVSDVDEVCGVILIFLAAITPAQQSYAVPIPAISWSCLMLSPNGKKWKIAGGFSAITKYDDAPNGGDTASLKATVSVGSKPDFAGSHSGLFAGSTGVFGFSIGDGLNGHDFEFDASQKSGLASLKILTRSPAVIEPFAFGYCKYSGSRIERYQR
jgi:hypothetical protein